MFDPYILEMGQLFILHNNLAKKLHETLKVIFFGPPFNILNNGNIAQKIPLIFSIHKTNTIFQWAVFLSDGLCAPTGFREIEPGLVVTLEKKSD